MLAGAFFVWQWVLGRRNAMAYAADREAANAQARSKAANNATMAKTPPLAILDAARAAWENYNAAVTTPQVLPDGTVLRGTAKIDPSNRSTRGFNSPLLFGLPANN